MAAITTAASRSLPGHHRGRNSLSHAVRPIPIVVRDSQTRVTCGGVELSPSCPTVKPLTFAPAEQILDHGPRRSAVERPGDAASARAGEQHPGRLASLSAKYRGGPPATGCGCRRRRPSSRTGVMSSVLMPAGTSTCVTTTRPDRLRFRRCRRGRVVRADEQGVRRRRHRARRRTRPDRSSRRSSTSPPSATRSTALCNGSAIHTAPSASRQMPSGTAPSRSANVRRSGERAVVLDAERGQPIGGRLGDDQLAVGRDHAAVGEVDVGRRRSARVPSGRASASTPGAGGAPASRSYPKSPT